MNFFFILIVLCLFAGPLDNPLANISGKERNAWRIPLRTGAYHASSDASLFSSSLPVLPHAKCKPDLFWEMLLVGDISLYFYHFFANMQ